MKDKIVVLLKHLIGFIVYGVVVLPAILLPMAFMWMVSA